MRAFVYTTKEIIINLSEMVDNLDNKKRKTLINENIKYASDDALVQELLNRGFNITKG